MSMLSSPETRENVVYPDSNGEPIADSTLQFEWITTLHHWLNYHFSNDENVFVAGDLLWYPVEGNPSVQAAPDVMVVFGRPKGYRGSYVQHREAGIAPQVVFEVLSPGNRTHELVQKSLFYQRHGVEEYYIYDPDEGQLSGWLREGNEFREVPAMEGWTSPRLGVTFSLSGRELRITGPDGVPFASYLEVISQRNAERARANEERARAE